MGFLKWDFRKLWPKAQESSNSSSLCMGRLIQRDYSFFVMLSKKSSFEGKHTVAKPPTSHTTYDDDGL